MMNREDFVQLITEYGELLISPKEFVGMKSIERRNLKVLSSDEDDPMTVLGLVGGNRVVKEEIDEVFEKLALVEKSGFTKRFEAEIAKFGEEENAS